MNFICNSRDEKSNPVIETTGGLIVQMNHYQNSAGSMGYQALNVEHTKASTQQHVVTFLMALNKVY